MIIHGLTIYEYDFFFFPFLKKQLRKDYSTIESKDAHSHTINASSIFIQKPVTFLQT